MDPRGGLACHCVLVETGGQNSPTTRILWIGFTGQLLLNLPNVPFWANRDGLFLALVVRLAMEFKDSKRMRYTSMLASPRRAANSDSAHQYQVLTDLGKFAISWLQRNRSHFGAGRNCIPIDHLPRDGRTEIILV